MKSPFVTGAVVAQYLRVEPATVYGWNTAAKFRRENTAPLLFHIDDAEAYSLKNQVRARPSRATFAPKFATASADDANRFFTTEWKSKARPSRQNVVTDGNEYIYRVRNFFFAREGRQTPLSRSYQRHARALVGRVAARRDPGAALGGARSGARVDLDSSGLQPQDGRAATVSQAGKLGAGNDPEATSPPSLKTPREEGSVGLRGTE